MDINQIKSKIKEIMADVLPLEVEPSGIPDDAILSDDRIGVDSVSAIEILARIEEGLGVRIDDDAVGWDLFRDVESLARAVEVSYRGEGTRRREWDGEDDPAGVPCRVAVVDAYSSSRDLLSALRSRGGDVVHVQSRSDEDPARLATCPLHLCAANVIHAGDLVETSDQLRRYQPTHVVAASESGVELAESLAEVLGLTGGRMPRVRSRRDKHAQAEAVRDAGLVAPLQALFTDPRAAGEWKAERGLDDLVAKRPNSCGADDVYRCRSASDLAYAFGAILSNPTNKMGFEDRCVLVQEYLPGDEYVIDTVSCRDLESIAPGTPIHRQVTVWRYRKRWIDNVPLHLALEILPSRGPVQDAVTDYAFAILDRALGVGSGAGHLEIIWRGADGECPACGGAVEENSGHFCSRKCFDVAHGFEPSSEPVRLRGEPVLVEMGARLHGGYGVRVGELALPGRGQVELLADALVAPGDLHRKTADSYRIRQHCRQVFLFYNRGGTLKKVNHWEDLRQLRSYNDSALLARTGQVVEKTRDRWSIAGFVVLAHPERQIVEEDDEIIRLWNDGDMFEVV